MKTKLNFLVFFFFTMLFFTACFSPKEKEAKKRETSGAGLSMDHWRLIRAYPDGEIPMRNFSQAFETKKIQANLRDDIDQADWNAIGPKNIGGRTISMEFHPDDPDIMFIGSASGGLWKTTTAGVGVETWEQVPTGFPVLGVGAIAIDPNNSDVMYIGTGEIYNFDDTYLGAVNRLTRGTYGIGILKSSDGGLTWEKSLDWSYEDGTGVQDLLINPLNSNTIYAATKDGVFRTYDAGASWENIHNLTMAVDLEMSPLDTNIIFVSHGNYNNSDEGIYRSLDGGTSFQELTNGLPSSFEGKTLIAISPSEPNILYASIANVFWSIGLYKSEDNGDSWILVNDEDVAKYQGWYAHDVAINPQNSNTLIYVGVDGFKSTDGGVTLEQKAYWSNWYFGQVPVGGPEGPGNYVHADMHQVRYHPTIPNLLFIATDGGIFASTDDGENFEGRNGGLQTQQFYANFSNSTTDSLFSIGGMQDNATAIYTGDDAWTRVIGGDGMCTAINPDDDQKVYGSWQNLNINYSTDGGENFNYIKPDEVNDEQPIFNGPFALAPSNPDIVYCGAQSLFRSEENGLNWTIVSGGFVDGSNSIHTIAISPINPDVLYISTIPFSLTSNTPPSLLKSIDGGVTFTEMTGLPNRAIPDIDFDPVDDNIAYAVFSGFGTDHVYKTIDGGITWNSVSDGLPDVPTSTVVTDPLHPNFVYVGNDLGVYFSQDGGANWDLFSVGLPDAVVVLHLSISPSNRKLRVATHGNGVYESPMVEEIILATDEFDLTGGIVLKQNFPNPVIDQTTVAYELPSAAKVSFAIYNSAGKNIKSIASENKTSGKHKSSFYLEDLASGVYYYTLNATFANGKSYQVSKSFVKR